MEQTSAATILAETGADMAQFPAEKHLRSWAGVCPGNNESAGKRKSARTTGGNPWLRSAPAECAWAAANKKGCFLTDKFGRVKTKHGRKKPPAIMAVAHVLLMLMRMRRCPYPSARDMSARWLFSERTQGGRISILISNLRLRNGSPHTGSAHSTRRGYRSTPVYDRTGSESPASRQRVVK